MKRLVIVMLYFLLVGMTGIGCARETPEPPPTSEKPAETPAPAEKPAEKPDTPSPVDPKEQPTAGRIQAYLPLAAGNTWSYRGEGNEYASFTRQVAYSEGNLTQIEENNGGTITSSVFRVTEDTVTRVFFQGETYEAKNFLKEEPNDNTVILTKPLEVGNLWNDDQGTRQITELNANVETPAGRFDNCLVIEITSPNSKILEYYKEGVGLVKREFRSNDTVVTSELESFKVGP